MTFSNLNLNHHTEHKTIANDWEENRESIFLLQLSKNVAIVGLQGGKKDENNMRTASY